MCMKICLKLFHGLVNTFYLFIIYYQYLFVCLFFIPFDNFEWKIVLLHKSYRFYYIFLSTCLWNTFYLILFRLFSHFFPVFLFLSFFTDERLGRITNHTQWGRVSFCFDIVRQIRERDEEVRRCVPTKNSKNTIKYTDMMIRIPRI